MEVLAIHWTEILGYLGETLVFPRAYEYLYLNKLVTQIRAIRIEHN